MLWLYTIIMTCTIIGVNQHAFICDLLGVSSLYVVKVLMFFRLFFLFCFVFLILIINFAIFFLLPGTRGLVFFSF